MKKLFTLVCVFAISVVAFASHPSGSCGANLTWVLNTEDSVLTISGTGAMQDFTYSTSMPWYSNWPKIKRVVLPDGITTIGKRAFTSCGHLKSINIPESVVSIGDFAFAQCMLLPSINIPSSVTSIGEYVFDGCESLKAINVDEANSVYSSKEGVLFDKNQQTLLQYPIARGAVTYTVPEGVTTISKSAFEHDTIIEHIYLPQTLQNINSRAFVWCKRLQEIDIPNSVTYMSDNLFGACMELKRITLPTGIKVIEEYLLNGCPIESITIPEGVTSIGTYAFGWCDNLKKVLIPSTLTTIHDNAFSSCRQLTEITCLATNPPVFSSSETAFYDVDKLNCILYVPEESVELYRIASQWGEFDIQPIQDEEPAPCITASGKAGDDVRWELTCDGVLYFKGTGKMQDLGDQYYGFDPGELAADSWYLRKTQVKEVVIEEGITSIGSFAFHMFDNIQKATLPSTLVSIGACAFWFDVNLQNVSLPSSLMYIEQQAFEGCDGMTEIVIPQSVKRIEGSAFSGCRNVTSVILPDEVAYIGHGVFRMNEKITKPILNSHTFAYLPELYSGTYIIPDGIVNIAGGAMIACKDLDSLYIPNTVETIGMGAFMDCQKLRHLTIPASVVFIDGDALFNLLGLSYITMLGTNPPDISAAAFDGYDASFPVYIPKGSKEKYLMSPYWNERNLIEMEDKQEDPITDYTVNYFDKDKSIITSEVVTLDLPNAPSIEGFTFVKWIVLASDLTEGINIQAVYTYNGIPTEAPSVYVNPANSAQKLIRNGNIYILSGDKTYTITGQDVK